MTENDEEVEFGLIWVTDWGGGETWTYDGKSLGLAAGMVA
jgi:hypothetical protein